MTKWLVVMAGGGVGSLVRYLISVAITNRFSGQFPLWTFIINITGSFLIGLLMTLLTERFPMYPNLRLLLVVGFLGGYTTFSSFEYETFQLTRTGGHWIALAYVVSSVIVGFFSVWLGVALASKTR